MKISGHPGHHYDISGERMDENEMCSNVAGENER
jgi:hypothetical protein